MNPTLAAEGGYQAFTLGGAEWALLVGAAVIGAFALLLAFVLLKGVLAKEQGTDKMIEIAGAIQEGALAYLRRQFKTIAIIVIPLALVVFATSGEVLKPVSEVTGIVTDQGAAVVTTAEVALSKAEAGLFRTIAFILGCLASGSIGFLGMWIAVRGNIRTAAAARRLDFGGALDVAFKTGSVAGLATAGLGLLGASIIIMVFQNSASIILVGFGFGGSLLARAAGAGWLGPAPRRATTPHRWGVVGE